VTGQLLDLLDPVERAALLGLGRRRCFPAHTIVMFEGDRAHYVVAVMSGDLKVSTTLAGHEVVLDVVGPGSLIGELAVIEEIERSAMVVALTDVDAVVIDAHRFRDYLDDHPAVVRKLFRSVASRLRDTSRRQVEYGALDAVGRVCRRLVELADRYGADTDHGTTEITAPLTQSDIAAWAGLSREAVVRVLRDLRALGWVQTSARSIVVVDVAAVRERALQPG
jgi:CRP-like cAMP-binding protein